MVAAEGVIAENVHLLATLLAYMTEGGTRKRLSEQRKTQTILEGGYARQ